MQPTVQITFRDLPKSPAIEQNILERASKLNQLFDKITSCRVLIEAPHRHHHKGKQYHVRIDLSVPGQELVVAHDPGKDQQREDAYVAVRDAFFAAQRQLKTYINKLHRHH
jgi:ribosome-associated translation inhibitor RaiA